MSPFDLPGPQFLLFYAVLLAIVLAIAFAARWLLRAPADEPSPQALQISPYEVAYLRGGEAYAVNAAIGRLVHEGVLSADAAARKLKKRGSLRAGATALEQAICTAADTVDGELVGNVRQKAASSVAPIRQRLVSLGLLIADDAAWPIRFIPAAIVLAAPLIGAVKIAIGLERERPVGFLVVLCGISVVLAIVAACWKLHRSRRGDRALSRLTTANAALEFQAGRRASSLSGEDMALALGLFGIGILIAGPLAQLETALMPPPNAGSSCGSGGGCGSSGCGGGGCGGGGCGGCGG